MSKMDVIDEASEYIDKYSSLMDSEYSVQS